MADGLYFLVEIWVPPTGARVELQLIDIMRFDDSGLVCEHWGDTGMLSLMQQLGVVPTGPPHSHRRPVGNHPGAT